MSVNPDFRDLFAALNDSKAHYLLVGGYAVAFHAQPRFTKDIDIWVEPSIENAKHVFSALQSFGAPLANVTQADLSTSGLILQIGIPPNRIDIVTSIAGVDFKEAWTAKEVSNYGDQSIYVISRQHLIRNKRAAGRPQDNIDADLLDQSGKD
jgi:hypothetical protein